MSLLTLDWFHHPPVTMTGGAVAVGNFDGVHRGHRVLIERLVAQARAVGGPAVVLTFDPPPLALLNHSALQPSLTTLAYRAEQLLRLGVDHVVALETQASLLALSPEAFFEEVLVGLFRAKAVIEGVNFHFGRNREGTVETLQLLCRQFRLGFEVVPPLLDDQGMVSSSRIRSALHRGAVSEAAQLLGRPYAISGDVVHGSRRGRTIGFPTANLSHVPTLIPGAGVYAVQVTLPHGSMSMGAMNIGANPTFAESHQKLEVHLLEFEGDLYGQRLQIAFIEKLRDVQTFPDVASLQAQLQHDSDKARELLASKTTQADSPPIR